MSSPVTEADTFSASVVAPDMLDTTYPADVRTGVGALASRTRWLLNTIDNGGGVTVNFSDVTAQFTGVLTPDPARFPATGVNNPLGFAIKRVMSNLRMLRRYSWGTGESNQFFPVASPPVMETSGSGGYQTPGSNALGTRYWTAQLYGTGSVAWQQLDVANPAGLIWNIVGLPPTGTISFMGLMVKGAGAHAGLPATMPKMELYSTVIGSGSSTLQATVTDTSANTTAYQSEHLTSVGSLSVVIAQNTLYSLIVSGESSTNALVGLRVSGLYLVVNA
jgi:hypothetical protein